MKFLAVIAAGLLIAALFLIDARLDCLDAGGHDNRDRDAINCMLPKR